MGMSLADLDQWDPDAIHAVFSAVTDHSETTRQTSHGLGQVMNSVPWEGAAYDAGATANAGIQKDLDLHGEQLDAVANAAKGRRSRGPSRSSPIGRRSAGWQTGGASRSTSTTNEIVAPNPPPTDPDDIAEVEHHMDILHDEIVALLDRANNADRDLAAAINGATGAISVAEVDQEIHDRPDDDERTRTQKEAFKQLYGREPVTGNDWQMAAALDPHSYDPKYLGAPPGIVAGRFTPQPGKGIVRSNMFIPADWVWNTFKDVADIENGRILPKNFGDNRGPSAAADPEASRVSLFVDYDHGVVVVRQNPTVNVDGQRGGAAADVPKIHMVQAPDGRMTIDYNANDAYENPIGTAAGVTVNGRITLSPQADGSVSLGGNTTIYPSMETYQYRDGGTPVQLQWDPANSGGPLGPGTSLMRHHWVGDSAIAPVRPDMPGWEWELENAMPFMPDPFTSHTTQLTDPFDGGGIPAVEVGR